MRDTEGVTVPQSGPRFYLMAENFRPQPRLWVWKFLILSSISSTASTAMWYSTNYSLLADNPLETFVIDWFGCWLAESFAVKPTMNESNLNIIKICLHRSRHGSGGGRRRRRGGGTRSNHTAREVHKAFSSFDHRPPNSTVAIFQSTSIAHFIADFAFGNTHKLST